MTEKSWIEEKYKDIEYNLKTIREEIAKAAALSGQIGRASCRERV